MHCVGLLRQSGRKPDETPKIGFSGVLYLADQKIFLEVAETFFSP
jgi:hypothetical protein